MCPNQFELILSSLGWVSEGSAHPGQSLVLVAPDWDGCIQREVQERDIVQGCHRELGVGWLRAPRRGGKAGWDQWAGKRAEGVQQQPTTTCGAVPDVGEPNSPQGCQMMGNTWKHSLEI